MSESDLRLTIARGKTLGTFSIAFFYLSLHEQTRSLFSFVPLSCVLVVEAAAAL
jgi:hypothetical protein